jgi:putative transposase
LSENTVYRGFRFKFRDLPGKTRNLIWRYAGCRRYVYNKGLAVQTERLNNKEGLLNYAQLCALLPVWKRDPENSWLKEAPSHVLQQALKDLCQAFKYYFAQNAGFPRFHKRGAHDSFRFPDHNQFRLDQENGRVFLPKLRWLRYRASRPIEGVPKNVTVRIEADGFYCSVLTETVVPAPAPAEGPMVGVDMGVARFANMSDGTLIKPLNSLRRKEKNLRRRQRAMSRKREAAKRRSKAERKKNGGKGPLKIVLGSNYRKERRKLAKAHKKVADQRRDFIYKVAGWIANNYAIVFVEALNIANMAASAAGTLEDRKSVV